MACYTVGNDDGVLKEKRSGSWTIKTSKTELAEIVFINKFSEPPSLQHIAVVSIAIELCTAPDIRNELTSYILCDIGDMNELEGRILDKLFNSSLPSSLKTEISYVIRPIELQLSKAFRSYYRWSGYQKNLCEYYLKNSTIYWTVEGTVDIVKSLTELFDSGSLGSLDICHLYEIACSHCLGEYASILWEKIPEECRNRFRITRVTDIYNHDLIIYWTCVLENKLQSFLTRRIDQENIYDDKLSIDVNMIACSIRIGNIVALKYFWKKLSVQEKNDHLSKWLSQAARRMGFQSDSSYQDSSETLDVLGFLLSHVNCSTRMTEFFRNHSGVLEFLFEKWPYQRIFLSTIFEQLDNLQEGFYVCILLNISSEMSQMGNEMMMLEEIWSASPLRLRRLFLKNVCRCFLVLERLLKLENLSLTVRILDDASKEEINLFICFLFSQPQFKRVIDSNNLNSLHMLLSKSTLPPECYPYNSNRNVLITSWLIRVKNWHICIDWICDGNIQAVESFLRWSYQSVGFKTFMKGTWSPHVIYLTLIFLSNYERVDQFLNWYFKMRIEIQQFKVYFLRRWDNFYFKRFIDMPFILSKREGDVLQKFINYNLSSLKDIHYTQFRVICRSCIEYALSRGFLESATLLLNASFDNINEVKKYKSELSEKGIKKVLLLNQSLTDDDWNHAKEIVMWSSPLTLNTVTKLKSLILEQKTSHSYQDELNPQISALLDLLDNVVEKADDS